jgi:ribosomal protein S18 acetylase RimI-like enzyme
MLSYKAMESVALEVLHSAFVDAFSDYQVKIELPLWKFQQMLQRRGFHPEISVGAFDGDSLVGFVLNGLRSWDGKITVYDLGTAVLPAYRRQGITKDMLLSVQKLLKNNQVEQYLLEVITSNESAFQLYEKQGFRIQREFLCFMLEKERLNMRTSWPVEQVKAIDFDQCKEFWDFKPSWQNSIESVNAAIDTFHIAVVRMGATIAGYGIIDKKTGDIPQLAVHKAYRRQRIAESILAELIKNTEAERIGIMNVEVQAENMEGFLKKLGFTNHVGQYEMLLEI